MAASRTPRSESTDSAPTGRRPDQDPDRDYGDDADRDCGDDAGRYAGDDAARYAGDDAVQDPGQRLIQAVASRWPDPAARLLLAVSGGVDSSALMLLAAACLGRARLVVAHVDHGMQADAGRWADQVRDQAASLGLTFHLCRLDGRSAAARRHDGLGPEGWARRERYRALAELARELGAVAVLTGHQRDDQIETHLLQAGRGAGDRGLAAMAAARPLCAGPAGPEGPWLLRPFLAVPRSRLAEVVWQAGWQAIVDPSNHDQARRRSHLRLARAGPGSTDRDDLVLATIARHRARDELARARAEADLASAWIAESRFTRLNESNESNESSIITSLLSRQALIALAPARRAEVWRFWLAIAGLAAPTRRRLEEIDRQMVVARGSEGRVAHDGCLVVRYRDRVGLLERLPAPVRPGQLETRLLRGQVNGGPVEMALVDGYWVLTRAQAGAGAKEARGATAAGRSPCWDLALPVDLPDRVLIGAGRAEERWRGPVPEGGSVGPSHALRKLWQEGGVPPWLRPALPVFRDPVNDRLLAAFPFGQVDRREGPAGAAGGPVLRWRPPPAWLPWLDGRGRRARTTAATTSI